MKAATPIGKNYLSGAAGRLFQRSPNSHRERMEQFLADTRQDGEARYLVFQWLTDNDTATREKRLESMLEDPSLELRHDAIALALNKLRTKRMSPSLTGYSMRLAIHRRSKRLPNSSKKPDNRLTSLASSAFSSSGT